MQKIMSIFYLECISLLRRSQDWLHPVGLYLIVMCLFPILFSADKQFLHKYFYACVWIATLFANLLAIQNFYQADLEDGFLEQRLLHYFPLSLYLFIKMCAYWVVIFMPIIFIMPVSAFLFNVYDTSIFILLLTVSLGTILFILLGVFGLTLTLSLRQQGALLGAIIFPLLIPILIFGVNISTQYMAGFAITGPLAFLMSVTLFATLVFPWLIAKTLRLSFDNF